MPTQIRWSPPVPWGAAEEPLRHRLRRTGKFYLFLRTIRHELFDAAFQAELAAAYQPRGTAPLPAALLAMVTLLQAYTQTGDAEAVTAAEVDQRWQLVLDCMGCAHAPFSQGALVKFRERMIAHDLDQKLLDRTVALAKAHGGFGWQALRAALDSSPLIGAGRVQDTWNLIGRALATVATCARRPASRTRAHRPALPVQGPGQALPDSRRCAGDPGRFAAGTRSTRASPCTACGRTAAAVPAVRRCLGTPGRPRPGRLQ